MTFNTSAFAHLVRTTFMNDFHPPAILEHKCYQQSVTIITKDLCVFVRVSSHHIEVGEAASDGPKN